MFGKATSSVVFSWIKRTFQRTVRVFSASKHSSDAQSNTASGAPQIDIARSIENVESVSDDAMPFDEHLLERARTQWQFGDWEALAKLSRETLQHHPDRAKLALLVATAHQQNNDTGSAREYVRLAQIWGCHKALVSQMLISGMHNILGRAAVIGADEPRAQKHFESAIRIGTPGADMRLVAHARRAHQMQQIESSMATAIALADGDEQEGERYEAIGVHQNATQAEQTHTQQVGRARQLAMHDLGTAWAANTINTAIFRHHGILTVEGFQFTAFYVDQTHLRLVRRDLATDQLNFVDLASEYNLRDAHNSINIGADRLGFIHLCYDHHGTALRYRRSLAPLQITDWSEELVMTGQYEDTVTYPCFLMGIGQPLLLLYRDGSWKRGAARIKEYDEIAQCWTDRPEPILSGAQQRPWTSNPYWNHPVFGSDGALHLSFVWRTHALGDEARINNINIGYACSPDGGRTWHTVKRRDYRLPITQVNAETVFPVSPGSNLINQCSMAVDNRGRPHIVFYADDADGIPQYQHLWFDGRVWHHHVVSRRKQPFALLGGGTLHIPISRPEIVIDRKDNVHIIYRGDLTEDRMTALTLAAPHYRIDDARLLTLWDEPLGQAEPVIDRIRWQNDNVLSMLIQHNLQPDGDVGHQEWNTPVRLVDIDLSLPS